MVMMMIVVAVLYDNCFYHNRHEPTLLGSIIFTAQSDGANILCSPVLLDND